MALLLLAGASVAEPVASTARISIVIDDMGDQLDAGQRALQLPGAVTYAFLPHTPHSHDLAEAAHRLGKEVMLHLPMQAMGSNNLLGPGALTLDMSREHFIHTLQGNLQAVPHIAGVNNHMGSLLTRHPGHMQWLMETLKQRHPALYFIDSRTTHHTVARQLAGEHGVPARQRDVFLDDDPDQEAVQRQFRRLIDKAQRQGSAIGIGHPYDTTLTVLAQMIPRLAANGIELVPASALIHNTPTTRLAGDTGKATTTLVFNASPGEGARAAPPTATAR